MAANINGLVVLAMGGVIPDCVLGRPYMTGIDEFQLCLWIFVVVRSTWTIVVGTGSADANSLLCLQFSSQHVTNSCCGNNPRRLRCRSRVAAGPQSWSFGFLRKRSLG